MNKISIVSVLSFLLFLFSSCSDKIVDEIRSSGKHINIMIDGKEYRNLDRIFPILEPPHPYFSYYWTEKYKYFRLFSECIPKRDAGRLPGNNIYFGLHVFLDEPIQIGKKYNIQSLPNLNYFMTSEIVDFYRNNEISYCYLEGSGYCFGNGFVEIVSIDLANNYINGIFEFNTPFTKLEKKDNPPIVHVIGKFKANFPTQNK